MKQMDYAEVMAALKASSRTFFIPITRLPDGLRDAVAAAYLCMRAIDDIEDHPTLDNATKEHLLRQISVIFQTQTYEDGFDVTEEFDTLLLPFQHTLAEVSTKLGLWASCAPPSIAPAIWDATAAMADRMAYWLSVDWKIQTRADLDGYTYSVAGTVGLLLGRILTWYDGTQLDQSQSVNFGRALQLTNIARNRVEDLSRGVDFYPKGWDDAQMREYAMYWLTRAETFSETLPSAPFNYFIQIPLALAKATLEALDAGQAKLSREAVLQIAGEPTT